MDSIRGGHSRSSVWLGRLPWLAACLPLLLGSIRAAGAERLAATVLTRDLGDPRAPGNLKLAVTLPDGMRQRAVAAAPRDFSVYVYPERLSEAEGTVPAYLAKGIYLWRSGSNIFLDARQAPSQDADCQAAVKVIFHPGGATEAEGIADGQVVYATQLVDVVLAVDISSSMNHTDPRRRRVAAASSFIEMARRGGGIGRVGLVIFNSRARLVTPLLPLGEGEILLEALQRIGADGMTSLDAPLRMGMEALTEGEGSQRPVVILLTDGRNEGSRYRDTHLELAERGIRIFTVGLTELADHQLLKEMADASGGLYFRAPTDEDLPEVYARLAAELGKRRLLLSDLLHSERGLVQAPIDSTVKSLVAFADGGARVGASRPEGTGARAGGAMSIAHLVEPEPGPWEFSWENAAPGVSVMSLFGDTQFFLDVFPPQLRGARLALGATLAEGTLPLAGADVWAESVPGVIDSPVEMFDDGQHGDGEAGDGVYGAIVDFHRDDVERFDMTFRAGGAAWRKGDFVRQAEGLALRSHEPSGGGSVKLDGDIDFGVLYPGESGTALARINLDAGGPRELDFDLYWHADADAWPDMSSRAVAQPGRRDFQLEMIVPENARPGDYAGSFSISDRDELSDAGVARVRVGSVRFTQPPYVDLGVIPPGTFSASDLRIPYSADKEADFSLEFDGDEDLRVASGMPGLSAGEGEIVMEAVVTVPMGKPEGEYSGRVRLFAGPGSAEIPLRWRVESYSVAGPSEIAPVGGVPELPELPEPDGMAALAEPPPMDAFPFSPGEVRREAIDSDAAPSPWDRAAEAIRNEPALPPVASLPGSAGRGFPAAVEPEESSGDSFWSAWWVYLLALLLLLLLLLLLIVYVLYRLGKSELARLLLVSGLANLLLLAVFIALLGASTGVSPELPPTVTVNLVRDDYQPASEYYSDLEKEMLTAPSPDSTPVSSAETALDNPDSAVFEGVAPLERRQSGSGGLVNERQAEVAADGSEAPSGMLMAVASSSSAATPMENAAPTPMNRRERERRADRSSMPAPTLELPDADAPPAEAGEKVGEHVDVGEPRLDMEADVNGDRPVWSDGERVAPSPVMRESGLLAGNSGMEAVGMDLAPRRMDPQGRRRNERDVSDAYPEPRVEIADPVRDNETVAAPDAADDGEGPPGVEEIRTELRSMGARSADSKPAAVAAPAASSLDQDMDRQVPRGVSGDEESIPSLAHGGSRSQRGRVGRAGASRPGPTGNLPGGLLSVAAGNPGKNVASAAGNAENGGNIGEKRFDAAPAGGGQPNAGIGIGSSSPPDGEDPGLAPSQLGSGGESANGGDDGRVAFAPGGGDLSSDGSGDRGGDGRGPRQGPGRGHGGDYPQGLEGLPGLTPGEAGQGSNGDGSGAGPGRRGGGGVGEGRFDDLPGAGGGFDLVQRGNAASSGMGGSILGGGGSDIGPGAVSLPRDDEDWFIERRREPRRQVTAASSSLEIDGLFIVVGDFAHLPDPAAEHLFASLANRIGGGMAVEERRLAPNDDNLSDTLLAVLSPEEARGWSDDDISRVGGYLAGGGHIWMDSSPRARADDVMRILAKAAGGEFGPLPASHQLSEHGEVGAITIGDRMAAVSTTQDWRTAWRYKDDDNGTGMRFFVRCLNYFLSGNAESGIVLAPAELRGDLYVEPHSERIPDSLSSGEVSDGRVWDSFESAAADVWRMPSWSDPGEVSIISDGQGGRALKLDLAAAAKGRAAVSRGLNPHQDFSRVKRVALDVYHDGDGDAAVSLVFTVPAAGGWADYETPPVRLGPGWNRAEFDLGGMTFRALAGGGGFVSAPTGTDRVGRIGFFLYRNGASPAIAMFRDIRLHER